MNFDDQRLSAKSELIHRSTPIAISQVSSATGHELGSCSICAVISLVWPYSSSTKSLSFLLSDPDFRLRGTNGRIRATFQGPAAEKVAETRAGIGDEVILDLQGCILRGDDDASRIRELRFDSRVFLEVCNSPLLVDLVPETKQILSATALPFG